MNGGKTAGGYTIVETMIFLAVTAALFIIAYSFITNKQSDTEFNQSTRDFQSQLENVINDVTDGFYPSTNNFTCNASASGPTYDPSHSTNQGQNEQCIFAGKVLQFTQNSSSYNIYTMAGLRQTSTLPTHDVQSLDDALLTAVAQPAGADVTSSGNFTYGMTVDSVYCTNCGGLTPVASVGFFSSIKNLYGTSDLSGVPNLLVIPIKSALTDTTSHAAFATSRLNPPAPGIPRIQEGNANPSSVVICTVAGNGKKAAYIVGSNGRQTTVQMQIGAYGSCP